MKFHKYERARDYEVEEYFAEKLKLNPYQKELLRDQEIVRWAPFEFFRERKKVTNVWIRLSVVLFPFALILLIISLPFNFLFTGRWGYSLNDKYLRWFDTWRTNLGL